MFKLMIIKQYSTVRIEMLQIFLADSCQGDRKMQIARYRGTRKKEWQQR